LKFQDEIELDGLDNVGIAFDSMSVSPATFAQTRLMLPALKKLFPAEVEEMSKRKKCLSTRGQITSILGDLLGEATN